MKRDRSLFEENPLSSDQDEIELPCEKELIHGSETDEEAGDSSTSIPEVFDDDQDADDFDDEDSEGYEVEDEVEDEAEDEVEDEVEDEAEEEEEENTATYDEVKFGAEDFSVEMSEEDLELFNQNYFTFMDELRMKAQNSHAAVQGMILGSPQDLNPVPKTVEEFWERVPHMLICDEASELREAIETDLEEATNHEDMDNFLENNLNAIRSLQEKSSWTLLTQYLAVLTDAVFESDYISKLKFPENNHQLIELFNLWESMFQTCQDLDADIKRNLLIYLKMIPAKFDLEESAPVKEKLESLVDRVVTRVSFMKRIGGFVRKMFRLS